MYSIYEQKQHRMRVLLGGEMGKMKFFTQLVVPNPSDTRLLDGRY